MIKIGDKLPAIPLRRLNGSKIEEVHLAEHIKGKKVLLFAVPGAFTPTCSDIHLPSFVEQAAALKAKGIDEIICIAVNDPYVLDVWEKAAHAKGKVLILSDGNGEFTEALGLTLDAKAHGLGLRSKRYVAVVEDGRLVSLDIEPNAGQCTVTCATEVIKHL